MRPLTQIPICLVVVVVVELHAGDQNVDDSSAGRPQLGGQSAGGQSVGLQYSAPVAPIELPPGKAFLDRFKDAFDWRVADQFADRLHPFSVMNWSVELVQRDYEYFRERTTSAARHAVSRSLLYSVREAAVDLPFMSWLEDRQDFVAGFLRNSIGSIGEEEVAPLSVSYRLAERSWWKRLSENSDVRFGIRPFRTSPYTFMSLGIKDGDSLLLLAHVRYHYHDFADHRFEIALSVPLAHGIAIDVGTSYQFGRNRDEEKLVIKIAKEFNSGGIVHVGFEAGGGSAVFAGLAFPW